MQELSENIFELCKRGNIELRVKWIPREFISFADRLSKQIAHDDWETTPEFFEYLHESWGPFTIDRFADEQNAKITRFNSKFHCPKSEGVNAFHFSWARENNYLVPPVHLVPDTLKHLQFYQGRGVLVVLYWESAIFYPLILDSSSNFQPFIKDAIYFDDGRLCVIQGANVNCYIGSSRFKSGILAMRLEF